MLATRIMPCLLLRGRGLVKTVKFKEPKYIGDPINVVKIFNEKEIDELIVLDITATIDNRPPAMDVLADIATECFVPLGYGGGIRKLETIRNILRLGYEKVVINTQAATDEDFVRRAAREFGSQSIVVAIDVKRSLFGRYEASTHSGRKLTGRDPVDVARQMEATGAGELLLTSIDRDGTMLGYDLDLVRRVTSAVSLPVVACGGASTLDDFGRVVREAGASAAAAGSFFVFRGPHRAVLITFPSPTQLEDLFPERNPDYKGP